MMIKLLAETPKDQKMIDKFSRAYGNLKKITDNRNRRIEELEKENRKLHEELDEYRKRHPSTVGIKNGKPYAIRESSAVDNTQEKRKQGAQKGHMGHSRPIPYITERIRVRATDFACPECHSKMARKGIRTRMIEDLPPIMPVAIQYRIERAYCRKCRKVFEPEIEDAFPGARFSIRVMLIAAYFKIAVRMSLENVSTTMGEVFSLHISEGEIQALLYMLSDSLGEEYKQLLKDVRMAPSRHMDTTSWRENGYNLDLWTFVTKGEAIFHIAESNNHGVAMAVLGEHNGTDIHDRFRAFDTLARKTGNSQQYCWSHIVCDAKELEEFYGDEGKTIRKSLQRIYKEAKSFHGHGTMDDVDRLQDKLIFLLDGDYDHTKSRKFVDNLLKRNKEWLFRFVIDPDVESTNNRAERSLRPAVVYRKTSGGSRSSKGSKAYVRLHSIFYTQKLRKRSVIKNVPEMINRKKPYPG